ncbi:YbaB/EbfC family nucleoid-associated protein [Fodinicola acaciae]|uniref:YbaB/EbfC family nucleoid-associated protein n=1 Tax=Fodinicola acaciae TaxID=2681555 RepID=UPI0013D7C9B9|nr:YbaB/EbfC family nucleoid-associated protein [Fodinicola acaciae]
MSKSTADQVHRLNRALSALESEAESASGLVTAVVGVRHDLRSLRIDPHVFRVRDADALVADVLEAVRAGCADVDREARALAEKAGLVGRDDREVDLAYDPLLRELDELLGERW